MKRDDVFDTTIFSSNNIYSSTYKKNYSLIRAKYIEEIDKLSQLNSSITWWVSSPAYRFIQEDNIYITIAIVETIRELYKIDKIPKKIILKNNIIKTFLIKNQNILNIKNTELISKEKNNYKIKIFLISIKTLFTFLVIKILSQLIKKKSRKKLFLIDTYYLLHRSDNNRYYGEEFNKLLFSNDKYQFIPSFISSNILSIREIKNLIKIIKNDNYLIKERYIKFSDLFTIFRSLFHNDNFLIKRDLIINGINYCSIVEQESKFNKNFYLSFVGFMNYFFFKNIKLMNIKLIKSVNWFENQPSSKGWFLGINKYFPYSKSTAYQGFTYTPEMLSIFPTNQEFFFSVAPKQITIIGDIYKNLLNEFTNYIVLKKGSALRFEYLKNLDLNNSASKELDYCIILSGIKFIDLEIINWINQFPLIKYNFYIKTHPIFNPKPFIKFLNKNIHFVDYKFDYLIKNSKCIICAGSTSSLMECISIGVNLLVPKITFFDNLFQKKIKLNRNQKFVCFSTFQKLLNSNQFINEHKIKKKIKKNHFFNLSKSTNIDKIFAI